MARTKKGMEVIDGEMVLTNYVTITEDGEVTIKKTKPSLTGGQIAVKLVIKMSPDFFDLEPPTAELTIKEEMVTRPPVDVQIKHVMEKKL